MLQSPNNNNNGYDDEVEEAYCGGDNILTGRVNRRRGQVVTEAEC